MSTERSTCEEPKVNARRFPSELGNALAQVLEDKQTLAIRLVIANRAIAPDHLHVADLALAPCARAFRRDEIRRRTCMRDHYRR